MRIGRSARSSIEAHPALIVLIGAPGSGKSHLATRLARRLGATLVQSDGVRKRLFPEPRYTAEESAMVFAEAHRLLGVALEAGERAVFDATNLQEGHRQILYGIAQRPRAPVYLYWLRVPEEVAVDRLARRQVARDPEDVSDATWSVYQQLVPTAQWPARSHVHLNAGLPVEELLQVVLRGMEGVHEAE